MAAKVYLAADLGASSGRLMAGLFDGSRIELEEVHRFANGGVSVGDRLYWNLLDQWDQIQQGLRAAGQRYSQVASVGVDTWGVDFALLGRGDELLGNPVHYRDRRTDGMMDVAFQTVSREQIFEATGLQFMPFNTLYQLLAMRQTNSPLLDIAESFLMMPDVFHWLMTGEKANEFTDASTTQFLDPRTGQWSNSLLESLQIPTSMLQDIAPPGTVLGPLRKAVVRDSGLKDTQVTLPGTHDTASAVLAVPARQDASSEVDWCYISSGTWSLMGVEVPRPIINDRCRELNFTNEGGVGNTIRLLKNIAGLWLVQECRRLWALQHQNYSWQELVALAEHSRPLACRINPDHPDFLAPADMPAAIVDFCRRTGQAIPETHGAIVRCALESLALRYRDVLRWLEELLGRRLATVHIVGGGTQNELLCQMTADACNCRVVAGPAEATALGNVAMQAIAAGDIGSIAEAREIIRASSTMREYTPQNPEVWEGLALPE